MNGDLRSRGSRWWQSVLAGGIVLVLAGRAETPQSNGWASYGGDPAGTGYSSAAQITPANVSRLKVAWSHHTGAADTATALDRKAAFEATPILIGRRLYITTPYDVVLAIDAVTGARAWSYDPEVNLQKSYSEVTSRGVSAWRDPNARADQACSGRIILGTLDARLIALDAATGTLCKDFGNEGQIDLAAEGSTTPEWRGGYQVTSAPAVVDGLVIVGSSIADNWKVDVGRGIVRAFDARTGRLRWTWDPIPWAARTQPRTGAGNAWSTLSVDAAHHLVYVPTGSASPDYFGGLRPGDNKWANSVVALRTSSGTPAWGFQVVHHDLWDYDVASQPMLFAWKDGTPAIAINTKMGHVFVLNRLTGRPLLPVTERAVPQSRIPGEQSAPTQPFSTISLVPERFTAESAWGKTPEDRQWCADKLAASRNEGIFTPPSLGGTVVVPGNVGGVNWGSAAYDPRSHLMFVNTNRLVAWVKLIPRERYADETKAEQDNRIYGEFAEQKGAPYGMYRTFLFSPGRTPCNAPPWGTTSAVDLFSGEIKWQTPLGSYLPGAATGAINLGGPIATAGGLVFTAAAADGYLRAFESATGAEIWAYQLPAGGQATPMTYAIDGRQYVVIAAGGHGKLGTKQGDMVLAFALPEAGAR